VREGAEELERREPVWVALSDLFLDAELQEHDFRHIARILAESGYADDELQHILFREVFPVCIGNLRHPAGVGGGFSPEWVKEHVSRNVPHATPDLPLSPPDRWMVEQEWQRVMRLLPDARRRVQETRP
jgi:hypothetical protein